MLGLRLGRRTFGAGQLLVMAAGPSGLNEVYAAVAEGADLVDMAAGPALVAAIRQAHPELGISVTVTSAAAARLACAAGADLLRAGGGGGSGGGPGGGGPGGGGGLAGAAAEYGAGLICPRPEVDGALAAGVDPARIMVELDPGPDLAGRLTGLVTAGWPVLVHDPAWLGQAAGDPAAGDPAAGDPAGPLAATAIAAWLGARVFRTRDVRATRRLLTMVAAIRGDIPPANATRGLA